MKSPTALALGALLVAALGGCAEFRATIEPTLSTSPDPQPAILLPTRLPTVRGSAATTPAPTEIPGAQTTIPDVPILPTVSERARDLYARGLRLGNNPAAFSKVGDCGSSPSWFLGVFDDDPSFYRLGEHTYLGEVIDHYQGSFGRISVAARSGFNASSVFSPLWSDPAVCEPGEGPLECEYRLHRPSVAFIMLGTNDRWHQAEFEGRLTEIVEYTIDRGIVPILATKPDNLEGDGSINATIVRVAAAYDMPLWNEWGALQDLPDGGLQEDGAHLTWEPNWFDNPVVMRSGWPVRNLTALQSLDVVWRAVTGAALAQPPR
jgi:hypothetical protein